MGAVNTFLSTGVTIGTVGLKKVISDRLQYIQVNDTPLYDMAKSEKSSAANVDYWDQITYPTVTSNNFAVAQTTTLAVSTTHVATETQSSNYIEEKAVPYKVSKRAYEAAKANGYAGIKDMWKEAAVRAGVLLKDAFEYAMTMGRGVTGDDTTAPTMLGLVHMASSLGNTVSALNVSGNESIFKAMLATCYADGGLRGKKKIFMVSYTNLDLITKNWTGRATAVDTLAKEMKIDNRVELYVSNFGVIALTASTVIGNNHSVVFEGDKVAKAFLYTPQTVNLGITQLVQGSAALAAGATLRYYGQACLGHIYFS